jgi:GNAT superfamily N-acetyltransferase
MTVSVAVRRVETKQDFNAFFSFVWTLYKDDPNWTPVLLSMRRETLDRDKNPAWEYLEGDYFVAWRGEQAVGTIAAFVNKRHNDYHHEHIAWFGFFETENNPQTAEALLQTAVEWAKTRGYSALRGPQSFTTHEECGLLIDGFAPPVMLMPYNPPYYQTLIEGVAGFEKIMDTYSYTLSAKDDQLDERQQTRVKRVLERVKRQHNVTLRIGSRKTAKQDFQIFKRLYNEAWEKNWGFTPMTERELDALIDSLSMFYDPKLACFVEVDGEAVGFTLGVPDFNQVLSRAYAKPSIPEVFTLIKALWHWKIRPKINNLRVPLMGITEPYRNKGLDIVMYDYMYNMLVSPETPYEHMDCGWVLEINQPLISIIEQIGMHQHRTYRFYQYDLSS